MCYVLVAGSWEYCLLVVNEWEFKRTVSTSPMGRVSSDALFLFMRFYKPKAPQTRPSELHLQSTVDKLSSSYVLVFNVSTVNLGRVNMDFGSFFLLYGIKFRLFYNLFSYVKRMSNGCQTILNPFSCQSQSNQPYTNVGYYKFYLKISL